MATTTHSKKAGAPTGAPALTADEERTARELAALVMQHIDHRLNMIEAIRQTSSLLRILRRVVAIVSDRRARYTAALNTVVSYKEIAEYIDDVTPSTVQRWVERGRELRARQESTNDHPDRTEQPCPH